jgi:hypothetical protein
VRNGTAEPYGASRSPGEAGYVPIWDVGRPYLPYRRGQRDKIFGCSDSFS